MLRTAEVVYWKDGEAWHLGNLIRVASTEFNGEVFTLISGARMSHSLGIGATEVLVRHKGTCTDTECVVEEFVAWNELFHYYGDYAPEGLPPHHISQERYTTEQLEAFQIKAELEIGNRGFQLNGQDVGY